MWVIEEFRRDHWVTISCKLPEPEARTAIRLLASERPWRAYRAAPA